MKLISWTNYAIFEGCHPETHPARLMKFIQGLDPDGYAGTSNPRPGRLWRDFGGHVVLGILVPG